MNLPVGRDHDGLVAGDVGLRREHVHALGPRRARRRFQREGVEAGRRHALQAGGIEGIEHADHGRARPHQRHFLLAGGPHLEHQVAAEGAGRIGDLGARRAVGLVGHAGGDAGAGLDAQAVALGLELFGRLGGDGDTGFSRRGFGGYAYQHGRLLDWLACFF
jgi:hypothetical protein